ncbi:helix-turn-helix transcriptional regulator [uncultured Cohaesibacter sp.]|uniref:helix-turn-helix domain-containing protein n=1 Tax=uncultured Cohaesibacter sp. TaxID=1002546 RepID=UPI00292E82BE|nr:helix-turn-helix transcriptional regulator [uncultured Cohaesibacter sp.]
MSKEQIYKAFGRAVAIRRKQQGNMTQLELAQKTGLSRASIANIERGQQNVGLHHLYSIASALKVTAVSDLLPPLSIDREREEETRMKTSEILSETSKAGVEQLIHKALKQRTKQSSRR